jgi:hypothetical protein
MGFFPFGCLYGRRMLRDSPLPFPHLCPSCSDEQSDYWKPVSPPDVLCCCERTVLRPWKTSRRPVGPFPPLCPLALTSRVTTASRSPRLTCCAAVSARFSGPGRHHGERLGPSSHLAPSLPLVSLSARFSPRRVFPRRDVPLARRQMREGPALPDHFQPCGPLYTLGGIDARSTFASSFSRHFWDWSIPVVWDAQAARILPTFYRSSPGDAAPPREQGGPRGEYIDWKLLELDLPGLPGPSFAAQADLALTRPPQVGGAPDVK